MLKREPACVPATTSSRVRTSYTGTAGWRERTTRRTAGARAAGSAARTTSVMERSDQSQVAGGAWRKGRWISGCGSFRSPKCRTEPTTPTTSRHSDRPPSQQEIRFPSALSPGQSRRASVSLTSATRGARSWSRPSGARPSRRGMRMASK